MTLKELDQKKEELRKKRGAVRQSLNEKSKTKPR